MHATAGKGGFAIEPAPAMVGPVFTGPTKGHRAGNAEIGNGGAVHLILPFFKCCGIERQRVHAEIRARRGPTMKNCATSRKEMESEETTGSKSG